MPEITTSKLDAWRSLTPANTQLLICDLQEETVTRSKTTKAEVLGTSAEVLCKTAALLSIPITFSVVPEGNAAPKLISPLVPFATEQNQFLRANVNAFLDPKTTQRLISLNRRTLVLAGFATEAVVLHTAVSSIEQGYTVVVALDACGGLSTETELAALEQIRELGGFISSVVSINTALAPDFTTDSGKEAFEIVQTLRLG